MKRTVALAVLAAAALALSSSAHAAPIYMKYEGIPGDVTAAGVPERVVQAPIDAWGELDIIVNNAGYI